jgi:hypothetical protein
MLSGTFNVNDDPDCDVTASGMRRWSLFVAWVAAECRIRANVWGPLVFICTTTLLPRLDDTVGCYRLDDRTCRRGQRTVRVKQIWWNQYLKVLVIGKTRSA